MNSNTTLSDMKNKSTQPFGFNELSSGLRCSSNKTNSRSFRLAQAEPAVKEKEFLVFASFYCSFELWISIVFSHAPCVFMSQTTMPYMPCTCRLGIQYDKKYHIQNLFHQRYFTGKINLFLKNYSPMILLIVPNLVSKLKVT